MRRIRSMISRTIVLALVLTTILVIVAAVFIGPGLRKGAKAPAPSLVVHEWGTFTSIAGQDGLMLEWRPLNSASDLPKFVHRIQDQTDGLRHANSKAELSAAIRMETPVLYFYSPNETEVSVKVNFPQGKITEWYPQARSVDTKIDWGKIKVMPGANLNLPVDYSASHYYAARDTDAAPVQVCATNGRPSQTEKFLFYRGVGTFELPLRVKLEGDDAVLQDTVKEPIASLIVFENRNGKIGYRLIRNLTETISTPRPTLDQNLDSLLQDFKHELVSGGLYEKEADAMLRTWRDSWFEEGTRIFYILPRKTTDEVLPIDIQPQPDNLVRVLVGRAEVITPEMEKAVRDQVSRLADPSPRIRETAMQEIRKHGRFAEPILKHLLESETNEILRARIQKLINTPAIAE